jgi:hypothetical protein
MQLRRDEAAAECDALLKDKSNEAMEQISLEQNPLKLQALIGNPRRRIEVAVRPTLNYRARGD